MGTPTRRPFDTRWKPRGWWGTPLTRCQLYPVYWVEEGCTRAKARRTHKSLVAWR
jgi:hypothetical protein